MALLAIVLAQILDPLRIVLVGALFGMTMLVTNRWAGWFYLVLGLLALAVAMPLLIDQTPDQRGTAVMVGVLSNALLVTVFMLLTKIWRSF